MAKYAIVERNSNFKLSKVVSRHTTLKAAKKKLLTTKFGRNSKGGDIVQVV